MITQITKKEANKIRAWQSHGTSTIQFILFTMPDGKEYKCDQVNPTGLKEVHAFKKQFKEQAKAQQILHNVKTMLLS